MALVQQLLLVVQLSDSMLALTRYHFPPLVQRVILAGFLGASGRSNQWNRSQRPIRAASLAFAEPFTASGSAAATFS